MVHLHLGAPPAPLAPATAEPVNQLLALAAAGCLDWLAVIEDRFLLPLQRNTAEPCDQRLPALTLDAGFEACAFAVRRSMTVLNLADIVDTDERCLSASVWSMEVSCGVPEVCLACELQQCGRLLGRP